MDLSEIWGAKEEPIKQPVYSLPESVMLSHDERVSFVHNFIAEELTRVTALTVQSRMDLNNVMYGLYWNFEREAIEESHSTIYFLKTRCFRQFQQVAELVQAADNSLDVTTDDIRQMVRSLSLSPLDLKMFRNGEYWNMTNFARMDQIFDLYNGMQR